MASCSQSMEVNDEYHTRMPFVFTSPSSTPGSWLSLKFARSYAVIGRSRKYERCSRIESGVVATGVPGVEMDDLGMVIPWSEEMPRRRFSLDLTFRVRAEFGRVPYEVVLAGSGRSGAVSSASCSGGSWPI